MSSSYGSRWPGAPNFKAVLMSQDVYANPVTPLTVIGGGGGGGGGTLPGNVPAPKSGVITSNSITITFDVAGVTGTQPISYSAGYSATSGGPYQFITLSPPVGTLYTGTASGLDPSTPYYFIVQATNVAGQVNSAEVPITTSAGGAPPSFAPTVPQPFPSNLGSLISTFYMDVTGITGVEPITYNILYGSFSDQTSTVQAVQSTGNIYYASVPGLSLVGATYVNSQAINLVGSTISAPPVRFFPGNVGSAPLFQPSSITLDVAVENTLSVYSQFANAGNGDPQALVYADYGLTSTFTSSINLLNISGTTWGGNVAGLMSSTTYYFQTRIYNSFSTLVSPTVTALSTIGGTPPGNVPNAQLLSTTSTSVTTYIDTAGVTGDTPITYGGFFGYSPGAWISNMFYTLSSGTIYTSGALAQPISTTIYFQTTAQNAAGLVSTIAPYPAYSTLGAP
jgi:hypothetical protein